ncbi:MAG: Crp/Fnr family transcriptional regulator [Bacteroidales bacterium]|nr:Crp/Fnr family transcriptional regulator [Bacteroidales bacterium]
MLDYDISTCPLFSNINKDDQQAFLTRLVSNKKIIEKGKTVARQGEEIKHLYLLVKGIVRTEMITQEGNSLEIEFIDAVRPLAPAFVFAQNNRFPVDVITIEECHFLLIPKEVWLNEMMSNETLLTNFLKLNSNMTVFLSQKLQMISIKSIKGKLSLFILENTTEKKNSFTLKRNRTQLAEYFGVQRPSLARTMGELVDKGIISIDKREVTVLKRHELKKII